MGAYAFAPLHGYTKKIAWFHISAHGCAKNAPDFTLPNKDTPKTHPILDPNLWRGLFRGVCFCALHGYMKNPSGFRRKPLSQDISGRMQYAPTRVRAKPARFHISAHGYAKNPAGFIPKPSSRLFQRRMQYAPTRVHEKFGGFHISAHGCAKNAPDFTLPNKDTPKTCPILDPNLRRRIISGRMRYAPTRVRAKFGGFHIPALDMAQNPAGFGLFHTT